MLAAASARAARGAWGSSVRTQDSGRWSQSLRYRMVRIMVRHRYLRYCQTLKRRGGINCRLNKLKTWPVPSRSPPATKARYCLSAAPRLGVRGRNSASAKECQRGIEGQRVLANPKFEKLLLFSLFHPVFSLGNFSFNGITELFFSNPHGQARKANGGVSTQTRQWSPSLPNFLTIVFFFAVFLIEG